MVEKESGYEFKALRRDRGVEFISNEFHKYCEDHGIRRPLTVSRINNKTEWKNRTVLTWLDPR